MWSHSGNNVVGAMDPETGMMVHHAATKIPGHIGLLIDTGAVQNLIG